MNLQKGQKVDLTKGNPNLTKILVELGRSAAHQDNVDLDASAFLLGADGLVTCEDDFIFYNNLRHKSGSVEHTGDSSGAEEIKIDLNKIPAAVERIAFAVTIFEADERGQNFRQVDDAYIRVCDAANGRELIRYNLGKDFSIETAVIVGELYRNRGNWKFNATGAGFSGGLAALGRNFGLKTENKTERLSVAVYPAVKRDIKKLAAMNSTTLSDIVNAALKEFIEARRDAIKIYDDRIKNKRK